jgi:hypothetical protein
MQNILFVTKAYPATGKNIKLHLLRLKTAPLLKLKTHPLKPGQIFKSPGGTFKYRVIGACCRLYDRNSLPYPCCRLSWKGKEPFWNRQGKRFVPDISVKHSPSYCVGLVDYPEAEPFVMTLYWVKLSDGKQQWWYARRIKSAATAQQAAPHEWAAPEK